VQAHEIAVIPDLEAQLEQRKVAPADGLGAIENGRIAQSRVPHDPDHQLEVGFELRQVAGTLLDDPQPQGGLCAWIPIARDGMPQRRQGLQRL